MKQKLSNNPTAMFGHKLVVVTCAFRFCHPLASSRMVGLHFFIIPHIGRDLYYTSDDKMIMMADRRALQINVGPKQRSRTWYLSHSQTLDSVRGEVKET
jgi:hypothetical protein